MVRRTIKRTVRKTISPIPKKIHMIWLGPKKPPYLTKFMKTFKKYAPGYTIRLWGDKDITKKTLPITFPYIQKIKKIHNNKIKTSMSYDKMRLNHLNKTMTRIHHNMNGTMLNMINRDFFDDDFFKD